MSDSCRTTEQCPACGQADLRPYGSGSKWMCPNRCLLLPCCAGGGLGGPRR